MTQRLPAEVLVVEGWIGRDGIRAAATEFAQGGYERIIVTGGLTADERWTEPGWSYAEGAQRELMRSGIPKDKIIVAQSRDTQRQRTYESAVAVREALRSNDLQPMALNVFTLGPHARRSRLVFAKVENPGVKVGVISWISASDAALRWWKSSDRAKELLTETAGYLYEALLNSGRWWSNVPRRKVSLGLIQHFTSGKTATSLCSNSAPLAGVFAGAGRAAGTKFMG